VRVTLEQGIESGRVMMRSFQRLYDKFTRTKDAPIKSRRFSIHRSKRPDPEDVEQLPEIGPGIGIETVNEVYLPLYASCCCGCYLHGSLYIHGYAYRPTDRPIHHSSYRCTVACSYWR
jgi:hypothetical protein